MVVSAERLNGPSVAESPQKEADFVVTETTELVEVPEAIRKAFNDDFWKAVENRYEEGALTESDWRVITNVVRAEEDPRRERAFGIIYAEYYPKIRSYVANMLKSGTEDAENYVQDIFIKAWRRLPETEDEELRLRPWLYKVATNVCLDELRHRKLVRWQNWDEYVALPHPKQVSQENTEDGIINSEFLEEIDVVMSQMTPLYRTTLSMRVYTELSYDEIGELLGKTRPAVKSLLFRARAQFEGLWNEFKATPRWEYTKQIKAGFVIVEKTGLPQKEKFALFVRLMSNLGYSVSSIADWYGITEEQVKDKIDYANSLDVLSTKTAKSRREINSHSALRSLAIINIKATDPDIPNKLVARKLKTRDRGTLIYCLGHLMEKGLVSSRRARPKDIQERHRIILEMRREDPSIQNKEIAAKTGLSVYDVENSVAVLMRQRKLPRKRLLASKQKAAENH